ncbi:hypothetical protein ACHAW6_011312 [Cyclotella cf. meneghiniana]
MARRMTMNSLSWLIAMAVYMTATSCTFASAFIAPPLTKSIQNTPRVHLSSDCDAHPSIPTLTASKPIHHTPTNLRRTLLTNLLSAPLILLSQPTHASQIPSVTSEEFDTILRTSAKSIAQVQLSGPKSETCLVTLIDGTTFSVSDLIESPTDPRSPSKLVARCRLYNVPVKNVGLLSALGIIESDDAVKIGESGRKKKNYSNERVRKAEEKEKEKRMRMEEDETERLEELYKMQGEQGVL